MNVTDNKAIQLAIKSLNIRVMNCRSGDGLMSYGYSFLQIGGVKGQSNDDVGSETVWDGNYIKGNILDCRGKEGCKVISLHVLNKILSEEAGRLNKQDIDTSLSIKEVAAKYGEKVKCLFLDFDNEWKEKTMTVNSYFIKDMEQGAVRNVYPTEQ